jgi:hypothetical protein
MSGIYRGTLNADLRGKLIIKQLIEKAFDVAKKTGN